jgi:hypothetical protein
MIKKKYIFVTNNKDIALSYDKIKGLIVINNIINSDRSNNLYLSSLNAVKNKNFINIFREDNSIFIKDYKELYIIKWALKKKLKDNLRGYCLILNLIGLGFTMTI